MSHDHGGHHDIHPAPTSFIRKYIFSTDHKVIAIQFLFASLIFVILGGLLALGVRYELAWPQQHVPHHAILPGGMVNPETPGLPRMTSKAPEANVGLWHLGGGMEFSRDSVIDGKKFPAKTQGTLVKVEKVAVTIPAYTQVYRPEVQRSETLKEPVDGFMSFSDIMGDYFYKTQDVRSAPNAKITIPAGEGREDRVWTIEGFKKITPSGEEFASHILLPVRREQTLVTVDIPDQLVEVTNAGQFAGFDLTDEQIAQYTKVLNDIRDENTRIADSIAPLIVEAEQLRAAGNHKAAAAKEREARSRERRMAKVRVDVPVAGSTLASLSAQRIDYVKETLKSDAYSQLFTMHASIMIFFVIIPMLVGAFGNYLIPLMIGARDMAFPKLNMLAFWISVPAGLLMLLSFWTLNGPAAGGWTMYPTLSTYKYSSNLGTTLWIFSVGLVGFSSVVGALNYITTTINMRAPGMTMFRMPLTVWSLLITSTLALFATPVLTAAMIMLMFDRTLGTHFFEPREGGQVLMFQHLFWFYSHPAVYIMILPAMGVVSDVLSVHSRKPIFGYKPMVFAMMAITGLGFIVWGHHMFQSGMNPVLGTTFMASTIMIALPSAIKTFNWLGTIWGGNVKFTPAMLNALGFVSMFVIGGLSGIFMASSPVDIQIHDTYFIVAHIHYVLFGGSLFGIFAGIYHWYPKIFGTQMNQKWGVIHFIMTIIAFNGTFFLMHILGVGGAPRRYASHLEYPSLVHLQPMNVVMTLFAIAMGLAQIPFFYNFFASMPHKLSRALVSVMLCALTAPAIMGKFGWGDSAIFGNLFNDLRATASMNIPDWFGFTTAGGEWVNDTTMLWGTLAFTLALSAVGLVWCILVTLVVFVTWTVGKAIHLGAVLQRLLYLFFLPAFLAPFIVKKDFFMMIDMPAMHEYRWIIMVALVLPGLVYLIVRRPKDQFGYDVGTNPWHANSLEWATSSPPEHYNFTTIPTVYRGPYEYSSPVVEEDYLPQPKQLPPGIVEPTGH